MGYDRLQAGGPCPTQVPWVGQGLCVHQPAETLSSPTGGPLPTPPHSFSSYVLSSPTPILVG